MLYSNEPGRQSTNGEFQAVMDDKSRECPRKLDPVACVRSPVLPECLPEGNIRCENMAASDADLWEIVVVTVSG